MLENESHPLHVCVCVSRQFITMETVVTFTACQGSAAPAWSGPTCQSKDVLGNNLKHYLWGRQLLSRWTMTSPKLRPISIYSQQCGTSHIKAARPGTPPRLPTACGQLHDLMVTQRRLRLDARCRDSKRTRRYLGDNNSCCALEQSARPTTSPVAPHWLTAFKLGSSSVLNRVFWKGTEHKGLN